MELNHNLNIPVEYLTGSTGDREMVCAVAAKVTYRLDTGWLVPVDNDDSWPVFTEPMDLDGVQFPSELDYRRRNIDIIVMGKACAPCGKPTQYMGVMIRTGDIKYQIGVVGDRTWKSSLGNLIQTDPEPFVEMPLTNERAYGGTVSMDGLEAMHPINPNGKGYYFSTDQAKGNPLPNLERPGQLIKLWSDRPTPACVLPIQGGMDVEENLELDERGAPIGIKERMFNIAVPELIATREQLGETLTLSGMHPDGDVVYPLPPVDGPTVSVRVGEHHSDFTLGISMLVALPESEALVVTYLTVFRYLFAEHEKRSMELTWDTDLKVPPVEAG